MRTISEREHMQSSEMLLKTFFRQIAHRYNSTLCFLLREITDTGVQQIGESHSSQGWGYCRVQRFWAKM